MGKTSIEQTEGLWPVDRIWAAEGAYADLGALLDAALEEGPQVVLRDGLEAAVVVPAEQWREIERVIGRRVREKMGAQDVKEWLLAPEARVEELVPPDVRESRPAPRPALFD